MAKVTLKDPDSKPKKFNKTVVLELNPMEAVIIQSLLANTFAFHPIGGVKHDLFMSLLRAGVPHVNNAFKDGFPHFSSVFVSDLTEIAEGSN